ncbi:hypothetical protein [Bacillus rubiinfantis]|uniref:hypothetical protein n=1 Tax=Bacillus rubiinfantis TaxID=1499680 RepID=UPI0005AAEEF6|nr:hypothetical protein [Bacillus rubiinfantis]
MDKPKKAKTITIKINNNHKAYQEELRKGALPDHSKVIQIQTKLIQEEARRESAAAQESDDDSFDWIIPETIETNQTPSNTAGDRAKATGEKGKKLGNKTVSFTNYYKKKHGRSFRSIFLTAIFAILIGTTIGIFMLKLVITEPKEKVVSEPKIVEEPKPQETPKKAEKTTIATIKQQTTYIIQGGVFGSEQGAEEGANKLLSLGIPVQTVEIDKQFYLFLGIADSLDSAKALSAYYQQNGVDDVYAKPLEINAKKISVINESEKSLAENLPSIFQTLTLVSSGGLLTNDIPQEADNLLTKIEKTLTDSEINKGKMKELKVELQEAQEKVKGFRDSKETKDLQDAQQSLLKFLAIYLSL